MRRLNVEVVCWGYNNQAEFPVSDTPVHILKHPAKPMNGAARWWIRARNILSLNFYGSVGRENKDLTILAEESQPDVLFCQYGHNALRLLPVALSKRIPLVVQFNGLDASSSLKTDRWYRWSLLRSLPNFAAIVVVGAHQEKWMLDQGVPRERLHLIPYGVPVHEFRPSQGVARQPCRFLSVGRFIAKKSPLDTIRAFALCARENEGVTLRMIGDGRLKESAGNLAAELGVGGQVQLLGAQVNAAVREEMQGSGVFVQHSVTAEDGDMEGWPVAIGEAIACGLPVVATRHGGILQQVEQGTNGFLVDEHDWRAMGEAMSELARNPELREKMSANARDRAVKMFDLNQQIRKLEDVLLSVMRKPD